SPRYTNQLSSDAVQIGSTLSMSFSGVNQFFSNAVVSTARNNFGIEAWARVVVTNAGTYIIAHNGNTAANGWGLAVDVISGPFGTTSYRYSGVFGGGIILGANTSKGGWAHVALVRDN